MARKKQGFWAGLASFFRLLFGGSSPRPSGKHMVLSQSVAIHDFGPAPKGRAVDDWEDWDEAGQVKL